MRLAEYTPRDPGASVLYAVVRDHFETFRAESACLRSGDGVPSFVEDEFRAFVQCGFLAGGFTRFRCGDCKTERLVAFSYKGRGFCPSYGGRRMAERAAHLVDHVLPDAPVRQWVLSVPHRIRYVLAWRHDLCRRVARISHRAVERHLRAWARGQGLADPRGGGIAVIQRFGGSVNLHVHVHALVLDGYSHGPQPEPPAPGAYQVRWEGFDLHAGVRVPAGHRDRLERLCRYALRPPLAGERLQRTPNGDIAVQLRTPWGDGTTHVAFSPGAFLARLAVLIPRPRVNLLLYHGRIDSISRGGWST